MYERMRQAGHDAARHGVPLSACPLMRAGNMPGHTGEPIRQWRARLASWEAGWKEESEQRLAQLERQRLLLRTE